MKDLNKNLSKVNLIFKLSIDNIFYICNLYEDFINNSLLNSNIWKSVFNKLKELDNEVLIKKIVLNKKESSIDILSFNNNERIKQFIINSKIKDLVNSYRNFGHYLASLNPLVFLGKMNQNSFIKKKLDIDTYEFNNFDVNQSFFIHDYINKFQIDLNKNLSNLKEVYCKNIGVEYLHIHDEVMIDWIQQYLESVESKQNFSIEKKYFILRNLIASNEFEKFLSVKYVGQKRFSLEGGDVLIPVIREIINISGKNKIKNIVIGMAHRGRLNMLSNIMGKKVSDLFNEPNKEDQFSKYYTGDVKYHLGCSSNLFSIDGNIIHVYLSFNPSHLEIINPVIEGISRALLSKNNDLKEKNTVLPIIIHGDAAFSGQGIVMETFNLSRIDNYTTGGTIHIVLNNQIGFTTHNIYDLRSTFYCTNIAKMFEIPVFHVNGNDPESALFVIKIAFEFRMRFKRDVIIDIICYRRHGHNEIDDPFITQPNMYREIKKIPTVLELYIKKLVEEKIIDRKQIISFIKEYSFLLEKDQILVDNLQNEISKKSNFDKSYLVTSCREDNKNIVYTGISKKVFMKISKDISYVPDNFIFHPVVKRIIVERKKMSVGNLPINWGYSEILTYASLLHDGYDIRISGQDSVRGTFCHRHAIYYDMETDSVYRPLHVMASNYGRNFAIINSPLSEESILAFEYGYSIFNTHCLVIWEAQFGDFANVAQVVIDQFLVSGESKWGISSGLVLFLPHGYEGQGPEHSSARIERFLQLSAQNNIQVCIPTEPSQVFHVLRRQVIGNIKKPLIIMMPKSLLRNKLSVSSIDDFVFGKFYTIYSKINIVEEKKIDKIILCCGKIYYEIFNRKKERNITNIHLIRLEQLYPFPKKEILNEIDKFSLVKTVVWCQEEPKNQGAWRFIKINLERYLKVRNINFIYIGRGCLASTAVGSFQQHIVEQRKIIEDAISL
ncbi:2-oxoglutarate dehydrogenase E1 component [Candidatus Legionella polyplacis]|uniref:oxoglutarate dehydrogenase (succinyl-transferring) n=1 Tax=Candidatus Legionella polyplacis TaxID=2005262 RepID=A0ABZ2GV85_9GAMM